jgi:hypothetical protein
MKRLTESDEDVPADADDVGPELVWVLAGVRRCRSGPTMTGAAWRDGPLIPAGCPPTGTVLLPPSGTPCGGAAE